MSSRPTQSILFLIAFIFLAACQPAPPPVLPNMLVEVTGEVQVLRKGRSDWVPITLGAELQPGNTLLVSGEAAVFCGNETQWEASPKPVPNNKNYTVTCSEGRVPSPEPSTSLVRGEDDSIIQQIPYALSPRSGFVLNDRPTLRWDLVPGVETYTVTLQSDDRKTRPPISVSGNVLPYPSEWPSLQANDAAYSLRVEGEMPRSDDGQIDGEGFSLLADDKVQQVDHVSERLRERSLSSPSETLLLAHLYLHEEYNLHSEAVELLFAVPDGDQIVAVQRLLGQTYLEMGLLHEATAAYSQALTLAESANLPEAQAAAHLGLSLTACLQANEEKTSRHKQKAEALYEQMGWPEEDVKALLAGVDEKCRR